MTYAAPAALKDAVKYKNPAREGAWDLVVFDRCAPEDEEDMPSANTWFIDELPPPLKKKKIVEDKANVPSGPPIKKVMETSPLLRHLTGLRDIGIDTAFRVDPKDLPAADAAPAGGRSQRAAAVHHRPAVAHRPGTDVCGHDRRRQVQYQLATAGKLPAVFTKHHLRPGRRWPTPRGRRICNRASRSGSGPVPS